MCRHDKGTAVTNRAGLWNEKNRYGKGVEERGNSHSAGQGECLLSQSPMLKKGTLIVVVTLPCMLSSESGGKCLLPTAGGKRKRPWAKRLLRPPALGVMHLTAGIIDNPKRRR